MKNITLLSILLSLVSLDNFAQESRDTRKWHFGVIAGIQPYGKVFDTNKWKSTSGFLGGLSLQYQVGGKLKGASVLLQPHWSELSQMYSDGPHSWGSVEGKWESESIHIPLLIRYTIGNGRIRPYVEIGSSFKFRTSLRNRRSGAVCGVIGCTPFASDINLQSTTSQDRVGLIAGVGAEVNLWKLSVPISIRVDEAVGTYKIKDPFPNAQSYSDLKTRTFQIVTGITF
ncbi:outer membrane beta-barrel protein [Dyadobacter sp. CY312]|uniref:outer membrane beta-barrel protein n=1 Tax=Dyadobacter sp. CY312 TaxID=2907303 RepID=UPI001F43D7AD|nr:outer membrane beta-barrel protein [Dyadobacter sp. CY312]MCE7043449.1 PorT family protein [Dyadobacter sp. CY312]